MKRRIITALFTSAILLAGETALAQENSAPIRLIVGYAPGGALDTLARLLADQLKTNLNQNVIVDNKPGAGQRLALAEVKRSPTDGRTLILANDVPFTLFPHSYSNLGYDPVNDFTRLGRAATMSLAIATGPMAPSGGFKALLDWAKAHPNEASYSTSQAGGMGHFIGLMLGKSIGVPLNHVPYKGGAPALTDLAGGTIPIMIDTILEPMEMAKSGRVRIVATTGTSRLALLPDVPTLRELGYDVIGEAGLAIYGPAKMPQATVQRFTNALKEALASPELQARILQLGMTAAYATPEETTRLQAVSLARWEGPVKASGFKAD